MGIMSSLARDENLERLRSTKFDLVVIGGGITGAGIALDASSRGMSVALVEKEDFASGTSSKSTKLIHGGLRYLKQFEVGLVREVGQERATVHKLAPHLVIPEKMLLPFTEGGTFGYLGTMVGLSVYDYLAGVSGDDKRKMLSKEEAMAEEPLLRTDILNGAGLYAEYRTDDSRLTIENIKKAATFGTIPMNYVEAIDLDYNEKGVIKGVYCKDLNTADAFHIQASYVINAAGPWVDELRDIDKSKQGKHLFLSKGVHIVVPYDKLSVKHSLYIDVPDGRMIFVIPRLRVTYIGTTDTAYTGDKDHILTERKDVQYLIDAVNQMLPSIGLTVEDVVSSWAGVRPLIHEEGKSPSEISRKDEIFESESGLLSIAGGKLTGYRKMAEKIIDKLAVKLEQSSGKTFKVCNTRNILLSEDPFKSSKEVQQYVEDITPKISQFGLPNYFAAYLVYNFGRYGYRILESAIQIGGDPEIALAKAELDYTIQHELVLNAEDYFSRRTGRLYFNIDTIPKIKSTILDEMKKHFKWSEKEYLRQEKLLGREIKDISEFK